MLLWKWFKDGQSSLPPSWFKKKYQKKSTKFYRTAKDRKCFSCEWCGHQIHPLAGTIFHKSSTSLKSWFFAMFFFSCSKNGVSGKELERQLGVTYKCAHHMAVQIRKLFEEGVGLLNGTVEVDETIMVEMEAY